MKIGIACAFVLMAGVSFAEVQVIDGKKYECRDGLCYLVEDENVPAPVREGADGTVTNASGTVEDTADAVRKPRVAQGYMGAEEFVAFIENREPAVWNGRLARSRGWLLLLLVLIGGLAMNLTPCVLPMIPINLIVIGKSAKRGAAYGLGIALAYGALGVAAAVGGLAFGAIQSSPWFNAAVAIVFVGLALALFDVWFIDFSRFRSSHQSPITNRQSSLFPFLMGGLSAVLAGACVAPVLISVLLLTADLYAKGNLLALALPFVLGVGMALPWPFAGAGMKVLPKPGKWMKWVNRAFGVIVLGFAAWYGLLAWQGWNGTRATRRTDADLSSLVSRLKSSPRPVLVDCWATWCKNCSAMERVMEKPEVRESLKGFTVIRVQAEDISELRKLKGFESVRGLPAFVIFE